MDKIQTLKVINVDGIETEHVIIDNGDGSFTSMTKAVWDELQAIKEQPLLGGN